MDIADMKSLLDEASARHHKAQLVEIVRMLIGLRKSWQVLRVGEEGAAYGETRGEEFIQAEFHHEALDVYRWALSFYRWLLNQSAFRDLGGPFERRLDAFATCILLNVVEGNGRFSVLDQRHFLDMANSAAAKTSTYLDVGVQKGLWTAHNIAEPKTMLVRIARLTAPKDYGK